MRKGPVVLLLSLFIVTLTASTLFAENSSKLKIGHLRSQGSAIDKDLQVFMTQISEKTDNKFMFEVYRNGRLGDYSVVQERVSFGEVDLFVGPFGTAIDKRLMLPTTPYLVNSWDEARKVYSQGSKLFMAMAGFLEEQNIKLVGGWPVYFGGIGLTRQPKHPENPDVKKNLIIRTPPIRSFELAAKQLGYTPYPITWTYAKIGLKTGMVAGIIGGGAEGYAGLGNLIKFYVPVRDHFEYWFLYMNMDAWQELSEAEQQLFLATAKEMEEERYMEAEDQEKESLLQLQKQGTIIVELSEKDVKAMREKVQKNVWPVLEKEIGSEFNRIISTVTEMQ